MALINVTSLGDLRHYSRVLRPGDSVLLESNMIEPANLLELFSGQRKDSTQIEINHVSFNFSFWFLEHY
jgi:hypothetical protein